MSRWIDLVDVATPPEYEANVQYHSNFSITLGELKRVGFYNPDAEPWKFDIVDDSTYERLMKLLFMRFEFRDIGIMPAAQWRNAYVAKCMEIAPKYERLYKAIGDYNPLQVGGIVERERVVNSNYPQTRIAGNQDYASNGADRERVMNQLGGVDELIKYGSSYSDVDKMLIDEFEILFSGIIAATMDVM